LPAPGIEALTRTRIATLLANPEELATMLRGQCDCAAIVASAVRKAKDFASLPAADLSLVPICRPLREDPYVRVLSCDPVYQWRI
jgi:hypothetical protein